MRISARATMPVLFILVSLFLALPSTGKADEVSKDLWVEGMKAALPNALCQSMEFFRKCFDVDEDQCIEAASLATRICIHKYVNQIPETLIQPKDGAKWANIIGQCAGENYHQTLGRLFKDNSECTEIDYWK